ncbi:T9SS type A sorting domain-containing protein [uncultured Algibacter sp.]|uniref:T9SS type A sorting domain-containing protein n=1 Tax=uncultured Algibacter sp. TaxID=298659 RepID=UPI0026019CAA|nr:T9SS type A sorting domain-containing protein [uncultured Algibacter sp.]
MKKNYAFLILLLSVVSFTAFGQITHITNGAGINWNTTANWDVGTVPGTSASDIPQLSHNMTLDVDVTLKSVVFKNRTLSGSNILTLDAKSIESNSDVSNMSANGTATIEVPVIINNTGTDGTNGGRSKIKISGGPGRTITFTSNSSLTVTTVSELSSGNGNTINVNCNVSGVETLRLSGGSEGTGVVSFTGDNTGFSGSFQVFSGNIEANNTVPGGFLSETATRYQVSGTSTLSLNNADIMRANYNIFNDNVLTINVNANQPSMGNIGFASGVSATASTSYNIVLGASVAVGFANSSAKEWGAGKVNITGFTANSVRFGTNANGLTQAQLNAISIDGILYSDNKLSTDGYLIKGKTLSTKKLDAFKFTMYPNPVKSELAINSKEPLSSVAVYNLLGKNVLQATNNLERISMSSLSTGIYVVKLEAKNGASVTKRIVKQ